MRLTIEGNVVKKVETFKVHVVAPQGMLYAFDSLYLNGLGPKGIGVYRLPQLGNDDFSEPQLIRAANYTGEHGSHALVLGPDKKIYLVSGNYVAFHTNTISTASPYRNFGEEQLLPRYRDGHGMGESPTNWPGGTIVRMNADGSDCQIFAARTRNIYDIAFSPEGELFGYDNDHEWDWGTPWYRPNLLYHLVSGGDFGFREGSAKMPDYYDDVSPALQRVSIGAPTGLKFATGTKFPEKYRTALFMLEWTYGRIYAVHLHPRGSTYKSEIETVVRGAPLNVTDIEVTPDGSMYFITGGHNTQSTLYRLDYTNTVASGTSEPIDSNAEHLRTVRHQLEAFHGKVATNAVDFAWPYLNNSDRNIRYAARTALEFQPIAHWKDRALSETNPATALNALLALSRVGGRKLQQPLLAAVARYPLSTLSSDLALLKLRVLELSFIHQGRPTPALAAPIVAELGARFPSDSEPIIRELCQLLLYLDAPAAIAKTLDLAHHATSRESQIYYLYRLSSISNNWTIPQRKDYFSLLKLTNRPPPEPSLVSLINDAGMQYSDGVSFSSYLKSFRDAAAKNMSDKLRTDLDNEIYGTSARGPLQYHKRKFVRRWKKSDFDDVQQSVAGGRDFQKGAEAFGLANCIMCHRFNGKGATIGPELTGISKRATARDILESILEPSNVIADAYRDTIFFLKTGDAYTGKITEETTDKIVILTNPMSERSVTIEKSDIDSHQQSKVSPMPEGLVDQLTKDEILDLIAYLQSGGDPKAPQFTPPRNAKLAN